MTFVVRKKLFQKYPLTCMEAFEGKVLTDLNDKYKEIMTAYKELLENPFVERWGPGKKKYGHGCLVT